MFNLHLHNHSEYISDYIRKWSNWEPLTSELVKELVLKIRPDVFVDAGANIGYFSLLASTLRTDMDTISIEPNDDNFNLLQKNILKNKLSDRITVHKCFLSDENDKSITLNIDPTNMGSISNRTFTQNNPSIPLRRQMTRSRTLDSFNMYDYKSMIVKIDVEEHECEVLTGMSDLFKRDIITHIIIEVSPKNNKKVIDILLSKGFTKVYVIGDGLIGQTIRNDTNHLCEKNNRPLIDFQSTHQTMIVVMK